MMRLAIILALLFTGVLSCSAPSTESSRNHSVFPDAPPERVIYYHSYAKLCNTTWETQDKSLKVIFGKKEKQVELQYLNHQYIIENFDYYDGIFRMESQVQGSGYYS